jgi:CubicO group peptidase (beta-lactamase class C family)
MRIVKWGMSAALALVAFSAQAQTGRYSEADEALYMKRFNQLLLAAQSGQGLDAYDTLEPVPGATKVKPIATVKPGKGTIRQEALTTARDYAERNRSNAFIVWRDGKIETEAYFGNHKANDLVVSKSLAKPVTAIVIGRALQLGKIKSLDQPVADFITEWRSDPRKSKMLIRHLLDMRTGFLPQNIAFKPEDILNRAYLHPRHDEVIINDYPLTDEPGTIYEYSNATSEMIAPVIERATGMRYGAFLTKEVLGPIGAAGGSVWVNRPGGTAHSGCCLLLPARDWLKLAQLLIDDGKVGAKRLLPKGYVAQMRTPTPQNPYYGLGVYVAGTYIERRGFANPARNVGKSLHSAPYLAGDLYMFDGNSNQIVYIVPSARMIILRTGSNPPRQPEWDNSFLPNLLLGAIKKDVPKLVPQPRAAN